jgi:GNAT superfamily N-acetyltransferase
MTMPGKKPQSTPTTPTVEGKKDGEEALSENYPTELETTFLLKDGSTLQIRPIRPDDTHMLQYASAYCPPETLFRRFNTPMTELSDKYSHYLTHVDYKNHLALIAIDPQAGMIVAVARYIVPEENELGEVAVIVGDPYQAQGLAKTLLKQLLDAAKQRGIRGFEAYVQLDNDLAGKLVRSVAEKTDFTLHTNIEMGTKRVWLLFDETS